MRRYRAISAMTAVLSCVLSLGSAVASPPPAVDNVYVANNFQGAVLEFTPDGVGSLYAQTAASAGIWGVAFDPVGNLYVAVAANGTVEQVTPEGVRTVFAAPGTHPSGVACDAAGNVYVAVAGADHVKKYTPAGVGSVFASGNGLYFPTGLAFDADGNLYVANGNGGTISVFDPTGASLDIIPGTGGSNPYGLAFDAAGNLFVANNGSGTVWKIDPSGIGTQFCTATGAVGLAFDSEGTLYVSSNTGNDIRRFSPDGTDLGAFATAADGLSSPMFLAIRAEAEDPEPATPLERIEEALENLDGLPVSAFDSPGHQVALANWLEQAVEALAASDPEEAAERLRHALVRVDGCTLRGSADGKGAGKDWIVDCEAAEAVYALLQAALEGLTP